MDKKILRLLILEDNPDDAELEVKELEREGFILNWKRVDTEPDFRKALSENPDLVLADYKLPSFSGMAALKIQQKKFPDIPLIIVSGTIGEDAVIKCIKSGAKDYVLKDRLLRLGPAVKRTIEEAEEHLARMRAEEALRESEERYRDLIENAYDMIQSVAPDGRFVFVNRAWLETMGYTEAELPSLNYWKIIHPESLSHCQINFSKIMAGESIKNVQAAFVAKDGSSILVEGNVTGRYIDGRLIATHAFFHNITKRQQTQKILKEAQRYTRGLIEANLDALVTISAKGKITDVNRASELITGMSRKEIIGTDFSNYFTDPDAARKGYQQVFRDGNVRDYPLEIKRRDGKVTPVLYNASVYKDAQGRVTGVFAAARDITTRKRAEEALKEAQRYTRGLIEANLDALVTISAKGEITDVNRASELITGMSRKEIIGTDFSSCFTDPDAARKGYQQVFRDGNVRDYPLEIKHRDGKVTPVLYNASVYKDAQGRVTGVFAAARDVTERKQFEKQLRQAQKMEAIGTLAGGIAHDFNNILTPILGFTELVFSDLPAESSERDNLLQVLKAGNRAKDLVSQILSFSRQDDGERKPVQLAPIVKEALKLLHATLPSTIEIRSNIAQDTGLVNADSTQVHQVLMNLCTNAKHAMPAGGVMEVSLVNLELDEKFCAELEGINAGFYVRLTVRDTGSGMDKEMLDRIYDPFFTTKAPGEGTGMGLSVVHGIVKIHGGDITVNSEPGVGTTFHVYLPVVESNAETQVKITEPAATGGTESLLFVDDEPMVVKMGKNTLERLGYLVTTRTGSIEALELFRSKPDEFDLIITDQTMPNMTGADLAVEILKIREDIPIILCTGFSHAITKKKALALGIREFVMKPIVGEELGKTVRRVLDESLKK